MTEETVVENGYKKFMYTPTNLFSSVIDDFKHASSGIVDILEHFEKLDCCKKIKNKIFVIKK